MRVTAAVLSAVLATASVSLVVAQSGAAQPEWELLLYHVSEKRTEP
jgi:hypothetical protein